MKTIIQTFLFTLLLSPFANAGLTVKDDLNTVFGALGTNYITATVSGEVSTSSDELLDSGDVVEVVTAFTRASDAAASSAVPVDTSPAYAALIYRASASSDNAITDVSGVTQVQQQTMTAAGYTGSGLSTLAGDSLYSASAFAYLLTSDTTSFSGMTFDSLETAMASGSAGDFKVAAVYDIDADFSMTAQRTPDTGPGVEYIYEFKLNQTAQDSSLTSPEFFGTIDGTNEILVQSTAQTYSAVTTSYVAGSVTSLSGDNFITINVVPEPSSLFIIAGLGCIGCASRRKKKNG